MFPTMTHKHYVQQIDLSFPSVQKSYFWLKQTLPKKVAKTIKTKTVCSSFVYKHRVPCSLSSDKDAVQNL